MQKSGFCEPEWASNEIVGLEDSHFRKSEYCKVNFSTNFFILHAVRRQFSESF